MLRDMNFSAGLLMIFAVGMLLVAISALLAPYLQTLAGYSVSQAGLLIAPRGVGTMAGIIVAGRIGNRVDLRLMMIVGILMIAVSLWQMTGWTPDVDVRSLSLTSAIQGAGLGLLFTPLGVITFYTLAVNFRTDGTAIFSLFRNVGSAIGISVTSVLLAQNTQIMHAQIAEAVTPFNRALQTGGAYLLWNSASPQGIAALNAEVIRQASIVAYVDDFKFLFIVCLALAPLILIMRKPQATGSETSQAVLD
jgi:DHA2 family multidrug resistance protein